MEQLAPIIDKFVGAEQTGSALDNLTEQRKAGATMEELRKLRRNGGLLRIPAKSKFKKRNDKWKYELIAYGLKRAPYNYGPSDIARIFQKAYPNVDVSLFDPRNITNYIKVASALIDSAAYKKYLNTQP